MDTLSVFVDESGRFQYPDDGSRFYILSMVFHDQSIDISPLVADLGIIILPVEIALRSAWPDTTTRACQSPTARFS